MVSKFKLNLTFKWLQAKLFWGSLLCFAPDFPGCVNPIGVNVRTHRGIKSYIAEVFNRPVVH